MKKQSSSVLYRTPIPPHADYANSDGRLWILKDGTSVSKGDKKHSSLDLSKYEVRKFVHTFTGYIISVLKNGDELSKSLVNKVESSPCKYYTITPKNYLYDDLGLLDKSILWDKPEFSYLDILSLFAKEIKEFLDKDKKNICIIEKRFLEEKGIRNEFQYLEYNGKYYHVLLSSSAEGEIFNALESHTDMYGDGIIVLTKLQNITGYLKNSQIIDDKFFFEVSKNISRLYTPVYDNESFLVWKNIPVQRFFTSVTIEDKETFKKKTRHFECDISHLKELVIPDIILLESDTHNGNGYYIYRYTKEGKFGGETWHGNIKEAMEQLDFEYEDALGSWQEIPEDVEDALSYVIGLEGKN